MTYQQRHVEGPEIGTPPRHHPTSTDHMIDVLEQLRDELAEFYGRRMPPYYAEEGQALADADAILKTYGR